VRALQYAASGLQLTEVPDPEPGPGEVVLDVLAAGLCHSDLTVMDRPAEAHPFTLPLVLGHETVGVVSQVGAGVTEVSVGDEMAVYGPWGCGRCRACIRGAENLCPFARGLGILPPGLGAPGGVAEKILVPAARHLVRAGGIDASQAAPLTDAGLTAFAALRPSLPRLWAGATAVVIGIGGLGHLAIQLLKTLSGCRVVALDVSPAARELGARCGADLLLDPTAVDVVDEVLAMTDDAGADLVLDLVASGSTLGMGAGLLARGGDLTIVGVGQATLPVSVGGIALGATVRTPFWGTRPELVDVLALARAGRLRVEVQTFALEDAITAYEKLRSGDITGRAVVLPGGER
jgi:propanol-preferring alcohol dehydrogenase